MLKSFYQNYKNILTTTYSSIKTIRHDLTLEYSNMNKNKLIKKHCLNIIQANKQKCKMSITYLSI